MERFTNLNKGDNKHMIYLKLLLDFSSLVLSIIRYEIDLDRILPFTSVPLTLQSVITI